MEEAMSYHSQFGEDQWIQENLNPPDRSLFCEVGAFDGIQSSNTLHFEEDRLWTGMVIEPNPDQWRKCVTNRPRSTAICLAIGNCSGVWPFHIPDDEGRSRLLAVPDSQSIDVMVTPLEKLWSCFYEGDPYLLSIDTEGTELDVWESCGSMRPEIVIMEYLQWGGKSHAAEITLQMDQDGYKVAHSTEANLIFVKK
jgi:FkbM family methyltransferase